MKWLMLVVVSALTLGCSSDPGSSRSPITQEEMRSSVYVTTSLASESNLLASDITDHRTTRTFDSVHTKYLISQVDEEAKRLKKAFPDSTTSAQYQFCTESLSALRSVLYSLEAREDTATLSKVRSTGGQIAQSAASLFAQQAPKSAN